jgi:membrane-associated phospholipid phosphatase
MRKFTTIILLFGIFHSLFIKIHAQQAELKLLKSINSINQTVNASKFISKTTVITSMLVPTTLATTALITHNDDMLKKALYIGASFGVTTVFTYSLKYAVDRKRPYDAYPDDIIAYSTENSASFPSGHTSIAFSTATSLSLAYPKWYIIAPSYLWASSVAYSRLNLGVHYPSDVLAGAVLGAGSAWLSYEANKWFWRKQENKKLISLQSYL